MIAPFLKIAFDKGERDEYKVPLRQRLVIEDQEDLVIGRRGWRCSESHLRPT